MARKRKVEEKADDLLSTVVRWYEDAADATHDARELSERDRDYYDGRQLTDEEIQTLKKRGQPPVVMNRIKPKIDSTLGLERQMRTDPRAAPRNPSDDEAAEAATDGIRYVCDDQNFSQTRSDVFENEIIEGIGGCIIEVDKNLDITIKRIQWDRIFYDPHSRERNFSDAKYKGIVVWMDMEDAKLLYPDNEEMFSSYESDAHHDTYDDKPRNQWYDSKRKRVRICEVYYRKGQEWWKCCYTKAGFLQKPEASKYLDDENVPSCPIEFVSANVDRDNNRYGIVRQLISPQDEINKRRSKALHLLTMRQTLGERGSVDDVTKMKREMAKPDGHVEITPSMRFEILGNAEMAQGHVQLLQEAKAEIDAVGANAAITGKEDRVMSGRALQSRQQSGLTELGPIFDALRMWQRGVYVQIWNRIKQYWTTEEWVRVTDDEDNLKFVGLNIPLTLGEKVIEDAKKKGAPPEQLQQMVQELASDPASQQQVGVRNDVSKMDVDIILEDVPDVVNLQSEQFALLTEMYQAAPDKIPFEMIIEASSLRNKKSILEKSSEKFSAQMQQNFDAEKKAAQEQMQAMQQQLYQTQAKNAELNIKLLAEQKNSEINQQLDEIKYQRDMAIADLKIEQLQGEDKVAAQQMALGIKAKTDSDIALINAERDKQIAIINAEKDERIAQGQPEILMNLEKMIAEAQAQSGQEALRTLSDGVMQALAAAAAPRKLEIVRDANGQLSGGIATPMVQ